MFFGIILAYLPYAFVTAFTPGPNNFISLYAVSQNGWKKGKNILFGIGAGFLCVMLISALFCYELSRYIPTAAEVLKYVGAVYILWLALHIAFSKPAEAGGRPMSFWRGAALQFINVKIYMYAVTIYTGYIIPKNDSLVFLLFNAVLITLIGFLGCTAWAAVGGLMQRFIAKYYRPFNIIMALILVYCAITLII